ncbi:MAG: 2-amino-4-hydroxy-6-hydroxymethyldihydropteridine diphosphokinase [Panacagrimonas sp.]
MPERCAYIGLGANLQSPDAQIRQALLEISRLPQSHLLAQSALFRSPPMDGSAQPDYCNAVCAIRTSLEPLVLLDALLGLERRHGRDRGKDRWGPRTLDLDLLHVQGVTSCQGRLRLPHPGVARRNFVLVPLAQIAADLQIPGVGDIGQLAAEIEQANLAPWPAS